MPNDELSKKQDVLLNRLYKVNSTLIILYEQSENSEEMARSNSKAIEILKEEKKRLVSDLIALNA